MVIMNIKNIFLSLTIASILTGTALTPVQAADNSPTTSESPDASLTQEQKDHLQAALQLLQEEQACATPTTSCSSSSTTPSPTETDNKKVTAIPDSPKIIFNLSTDSDNESDESDESTDNGLTTIAEEDDVIVSSEGRFDMSADSGDDSADDSISSHDEKQPSTSSQSSNVEAEAQYENWYFAKFDCFVHLKKGELEKIHTAIAALFSPQQYQLAKQLHIWISMKNRVQKLKTPYDFLPNIPQAIKGYCLKNNLCDEKFNLFPVTEYMMLSIISDAKDIDPKMQQPDSPRTTTTASSSSTVDAKPLQINKPIEAPAALDLLKLRQLIQSENEGKMNQLTELSESNPLESRWQFSDRALKAVTYLSVSEKQIKETYSKLTKLNQDEITCLGFIIQHQVPQHLAHRRICATLLKSGLIKKNGSYAAPINMQAALKNLRNSTTPIVDQSKDTKQTVTQSRMTKQAKKNVQQVKKLTKQVKKIPEQEKQCLGRIVNRLPLQSVDPKTRKITADYTAHIPRLEKRRLIKRKYTVPLLVKCLYETGLAKTKQFVPLDELYNTGYIKMCSSINGADSDQKD
jgi:hypothetical protein